MPKSHIQRIGAWTLGCRADAYFDLKMFWAVVLGRNEYESLGINSFKWAESNGE